MRQRLEAFRARMGVVLGWIARQPRPRLALASAAFCLLALTGSLVFALGRTGSASTVDVPANPSAFATATDTATATATATATPVPHTIAIPTPGTKSNSTGVKVFVAQPPAQPTRPPSTTPTSTPCPTPTLIPTPTSTPLPTDTTTPGSGTATPSASATGTTGFTGTFLARYLSCTPCGQLSTPGPLSTPNATVIKQALTSAAALYGLPAQLMYSVAYQESKWDVNVESCDGGIGLMQIQYYTYPWLNQLNIGSCDGVTLTSTNYNPYTAQGNADLGAKYLRYLKCLYEYAAPNGGTASNPLNGSSAYNYVHNAPSLSYPDLSLSGRTLPDCTSPTPTPTPGAGTPTVAPTTPTPQAGYCSLCDSLYTYNTNGPAVTTYQDVRDPQGVNGRWSCPFDPGKGTGDFELLDLVASAYNQGPTNLYRYGIQNIGYVGAVEYWLTTEPWSKWA